MTKITTMPGGCAPGAVILYRETHSSLPLWPSICLTEDATPSSFLRTRPYDFRIIVLKLAPVLDIGQLRWAQPSNVLPFHPTSADASTQRSIPGLKDAYDIADEAVLEGYDLSYWKIMLASSVEEAVTDFDNDEDYGGDSQMRLAIRLGIVDADHEAVKSTEFSTASSRTQRINTHPENSRRHPFISELKIPTRRLFETPSGLLDPSSSPPSKSHPFNYHPSSTKRPVSISPDPSGTETPSPSQKRRRSYGLKDLSQNNSPWTSSQDLHNLSRLSDFDSDEGEYDIVAERPGRSLGSAARHSKRTDVRERPSASGKRRSVSSNLSVLRSNSSAYSASNDIIEEDLDESGHFVQVLVGPRVDPTSNCDTGCRRRFQLMKHHVWDRPYFRDVVSARNYFSPVGENTWELVHPELSKISPEDFDFVAEFLSDGVFGIRQPENEERFAEFFAQCMSTWQIAEQLSMDDLLNHIVEKIHAVHAMQDLWDLWNPMAFACSIYEADVALDAHVELKALFSEFIAEYYNAYLDDDYISDNFLTMLRKLPELERDVLAKRVDQLERQLS